MGKLGLAASFVLAGFQVAAPAAPLVELRINGWDVADAAPPPKVVFRSGEEVLGRTGFDTQGVLRQDFKLASDAAPRWIAAEIHREHHRLDTLYFSIAPGDALGFDLELPPVQLTTLRLFDAEGRPAAHHGFSIDQWQSPQYADANGEFRIAHGPLDDPVTVRFLGHSHYIFEGGRVVEIRKPPHEFLPGGLYDIGTSFAHHLARHPDRPARLSGRLLLHDGTPAEGWHLAALTSRGGGWAPVMGAVVMSATHYDIHYLDLVKVADDGSFELFPASQDLVAISPEGLRFRYPLNPSAWGGDHTAAKRTTITLPRIEYRRRGLRFAGDPDKVAAGVAIIPKSMGSFWDIWDLRPTPLRQRAWRTYTERDEPPALASVLSPATSDKGGFIQLPQHPWQNVRGFGWVGADGAHGPVAWASVNDADAPLILKSPDPRGTGSARDLRRVTYRFRDSAGDDIAPTAVRWRTRLGTGRFLPEHGEPALSVPRSRTKLKFTYAGEAGDEQQFIHHIKAAEGDDAIAVTVDAIFAPPGRAPGAISGRVVTTSGNPAPDVRLHLIRDSNDVGHKFTQITTVTDAGGAFVFEEAPGKCGFYFSAMWEGRPVEAAEVAETPWVNPGQQGVEIQLRPAGSISVRIVDANYLPTLLRLIPEDKSEGRERQLSASRRDPTHFFAPYVCSGRYQLAYRTGKDTHLLQPVEIATERATELEVAADRIMREGLGARLPKPLRVTVRATREGEPQAGVMVQSAAIKLADKDQLPWRGHLLSFVGDTTDNAGYAHFQFVPGEYHIAARDGHGNMGWSEVKTDADATEFELALRPMREVIPEKPVAVERNQDAHNARGAALASQLLGIYRRSSN